MVGISLVMREVEWRRCEVKFNGQPRATLAWVCVVGLLLLDGAWSCKRPQLTRTSTISVTLKNKEDVRGTCGKARMALHKQRFSMVPS